jgi:hypothetical protein
MFDYNDKALEAYTNAKKQYPEYFKHSITSKIVKEFVVRAIKLFTGELIDECSKQWLTVKHIDVGRFRALKHDLDVFRYIERALCLLPSQPSLKTKPLDIIMFSPTTKTSDIILNINLLLKDLSITAIQGMLKTNTLNTIKRVQDRAGKSTMYFMADLYEWYDANQSRIANINKGIWHLSPMVDFNRFIFTLFTWMLSNTIFYSIGCKSWINFLIYMNKEYSMEFAGVVDVITEGDTNYKHDIIKSQRS